MLQHPLTFFEKKLIADIYCQNLVNCIFAALKQNKAVISEHLETSESYFRVTFVMNILGRRQKWTSWAVTDK